MADRLFIKSEQLGTEYGGTREVRTVVPAAQANLISSLTDAGTHKPCIDIDLPAALERSSTPGHYHLYIDKEMSWRQYRRVLKAMKRAGIIEPGYYHASKVRKATHLRKPGVFK